MESEFLGGDRIVDFGGSRGFCVEPEPVILEEKLDPGFFGELHGVAVFGWSWGFWVEPESGFSASRAPWHWHLTKLVDSNIYYIYMSYIELR